jgi:hypothetical protein
LLGLENYAIISHHNCFQFAKVESMSETGFSSAIRSSPTVNSDLDARASFFKTAKVLRRSARLDSAVDHMINGQKQSIATGQGARVDRYV